MQQLCCWITFIPLSVFWQLLQVKGFTCPIQDLPPLLLLLQLLQATLELACLLQYLLFLWFYFVSLANVISVNWHWGTTKDRCLLRGFLWIWPRENLEATENGLTTGETSLPGRNPETGWSRTGLPHLSSALESPPPGAFVEMQHPQHLA